MYVSGDARQILDWLGKSGIAISDESQLLQLELVCSFFFPNHVITVLEQVLSGKNLAAKLDKAQEQGWAYFNRPCYNLLSSRTQAWRAARAGSLDAATHGPMEGQQIWWGRVQRFLIRDMDRNEADTMLWELPQLNPTQEAWARAVRVAKERDCHSIRYVVGVLNREAKERQGKATVRQKERDAQPEPWRVPVDYSQLSVEQLDEVIGRWDDQASRVIRSLRLRYGP